MWNEKANRMPETDAHSDERYSNSLLSGIG